MARLNRNGRSTTIGFASKVELYKSPVTPTLHYGCETWTLPADTEKRIQAFETKRLRTLFRTSYIEHKTHDWVPSKINFRVSPHRNLFWQLLRDGSSHGLGMSHATTASPKPSFRASCRVGAAVVGRGNVGRTTSKRRHPCPCQNYS